MSIPPKYRKTLKRLRDQLCNSAVSGWQDLVLALAQYDILPESKINQRAVKQQQERNEMISRQIEALNYILDENKNTKR